jgi:predicted RNase H-like nuclease (RuvC/YqgF family)
VSIEQTIRELNVRLSSAPPLRDSDREAMKELKASNKQQARQLESLTDELTALKLRHRNDVDTLTKDNERITRERDDTINTLRKEVKDRDDVYIHHDTCHSHPLHLLHMLLHCLFHVC